MHLVLENGLWIFSFPHLLCSFFMELLLDIYETFSFYSSCILSHISSISSEPVSSPLIFFSVVFLLLFKHLLSFKFSYYIFHFRSCIYFPNLLIFLSHNSIFFFYIFNRKTQLIPDCVSMTAGCGQCSFALCRLLVLAHGG